MNARNRRSKAWLTSVATLLGAWSCGLLLGCDAQVGDEYTGEVMLTLRGHVRSSPASREDLVPALAFVAPKQVGKELRSQLLFMDGHVSGEYPSDFSLTITEPPPGAARPQGVALGTVMLVPPKHPEALEIPSEETEFYIASPEEAEDPTINRSIRHYCLSDGRCLERKVKCVSQPCQLLETRGERAETEVSATRGYYITRGSSRFYYTADCENDERCYREMWRCDLDEPGEEYDFDHQTEVCTIEEERGDASVMQVYEYPLVAQNLTVRFTAPGRAAKAFGATGYQLIESSAPASDDDWLELAQCQFEARVTAISAVNARHGTSYDWGDVPDDLLEAAQARFHELEKKSCPLSRVVDDPASLPLALDLTQGMGLNE